MKSLSRHAEALSLFAITVAGLVAFVFPLAQGREAATAESDALFVGLICAAVVVVLGLSLQTHRLSARLLAVLAALVAVDAVLRMPVVIGLAGFSPVFFLMLASGFVMGPSFGFAMGALSLLLSAVLTAGLGPWLPYQMLASGWIGMGAGLLGRLSGSASTGPRLRWLAIYGCLAGFLYGVLLDLWEWPFLLGVRSSAISWAPGLPFGQLVSHFAAFYLATSLVYDAFRAAGNLVLVSLLGVPVVAALRRFRMRFLIEWMPAANMSGDARTTA